jgi:hypothetical protein
VRVPGWRALTPATLDLRVREALRDARRVRVVARTAPAPPFTVAAWLTTPAVVVWPLFATVTRVERAAWLLWVWSLWAIGPLARRRRTVRASVAITSPRRRPA